MTDTLATDLRRTRLSLHLLAPDDVERVYAAALERLAGVGVVPLGDEARAALLAAGATPAQAVTGAGPGEAPAALALRAELAEAAAAQSPKRIVLAGRDADGDVVLEPGAALLAAGGRPAPLVEPLEGGAEGDARADDLAAACRLADALPDVTVISGPPLATGGGGETRAAIAVALRAARKHLRLTGPLSAEAAATATDIAAALRDDGLRRRPPLSLLGDAGSFAAAAVFARAGLPVGVRIAAAGDWAPGDEATTPAAVTEAVVACVADVLAANAAVQALAPGAAFVAPVWPASAGIPATGPDAATFVAAATQVLTRAGFPVAAHIFATSAPGLDWRACTDGAFAALAAGAAGAALLTGAGTLRGGAVFSPRQLVADAEIHSWCTAVAAGIPVDDETIAVDAIKDVGIGGNFLGEKHTRRHMKDVWRPRLLDRSLWDAWVAGGRQGAADKAAELAGALLAQHEVAPLDDERAAILERIIAAAGL
jgi:trimethylamine--corrinoid protein Co-methyltransferase